VAQEVVSCVWEDAGVSDWISAEYLPEEDGTYICHFSDGIIETFPYESGDFNRPWGVHNVVVTHWMPLPDPPEVEK